MKKFFCLIISVALIFGGSSNVFAIKTINNQWSLTKTPSELIDDEIMYQCSFTAKLDHTYKGTWLYDLSENGTINATLTRTNYVQAEMETYTAPISDYILTIEKNGKKYSMFNDSSNAEFGSKGVLEFSDLHYYIDENNRTVTYYINPDEPLYVIHMNLNDYNGEKHIQFFIYSWYAGKVNGEYVWKSETVNVDSSDIIEYDKLVTDDKTESYYVYNNGHNDYSEKSGILNTNSDAAENTRIICGEDYDDVYDYNVEYTAEFTANIKNSQTVSQLSNDGNITATYYGISVSCKGKDGTPKVGRNTKLLRLKGNKLERWYEVSAIEYPDIKIEGALIHGKYDKVSNDAQIYEGFAVIGGFDGSKYKPADRTTRNVGITYNYSSNARTFLKSITFEIDDSRTEISYNDIDYTGKFMSTFFGDVFKNSDEILSEMGL